MELCSGHRHTRCHAAPCLRTHEQVSFASPLPRAVARGASPHFCNHMSKEEVSFGQTDIVRLNDEDAAVALLERAVTSLWDVVNELTRLRRTTRQNYRVTIFGSARLQPGSEMYESVKHLAS